MVAERERGSRESMSELSLLEASRKWCGGMTSMRDKECVFVHECGVYTCERAYERVYERVLRT